MEEVKIGCCMGCLKLLRRKTQLQMCSDIFLDRVLLDSR